MRRGSISVTDPWGDYPSAHYADEVHEQERPTHSQLLGPDGKPLQYAPPQPVGFDLRKRGQGKTAKGKGI